MYSKYYHKEKTALPKKQQNKNKNKTKQNNNNSKWIVKTTKQH